MDEVLKILALTVVAACAGAINAVAGGGTLISFPSLMAAGYSAKVANVTSTVAIWPGTVGGSLAYRAELYDRRTRFLRLTVPAILGGMVGSVLLLKTSQSSFDAVVPFLILFACGLLAFQPRLTRFAARFRTLDVPTDSTPLFLQVAIFLVAVYGGYFGAGIGILMLAFMGILVPDDLQHANAVKGALALLVNFVALLFFSAFGPVQWAPALVMAVGAIAGGYGGVAIARRLSPNLLRSVIVVYGVIAAITLLVRQHS